MKLWKKTVLLMLVTLLLSMLLTGGMTLYATGRRNLASTAQNYGKQMQVSAALLEQFWDSAKYGQMSETGKASYRNFQFRQCCGRGYILLSGKETLENLTDYEIDNLEDLHLEEEQKASAGSLETEKAGSSSGLNLETAKKYDYQIQHLNQKDLMLQRIYLTQPEQWILLSVQDITDIMKEMRTQVLWYAGSCVLIFCVAGCFIYFMMRRYMKRMEELQEVSRKQEQLMGALAHEMKTPMASIIGFSDSLMRVHLGEGQKLRALKHINREGKRLEGLSAKMLQLLGLYENDAIKMKIYPVTELVQRVMEIQQEKAENQGIRLVCRCEKFRFQMDIDLMENLLINLLDNAIQASSPGASVQLRIFQEDQKCIFEVKDSGVGIPESEIPKVTEAFYMADKSRSRKNGGAGLGLSICRQIVRLHGGCLHISSEEGVGTSVRAEFPGKSER
ncbi:MAG: HAMP domain-containing sensor histidine kinase [Lachnospiraceae bacterium]|nr:HAMP domain-containing sensor histidine kinase [Lachnospiraceae bacterium]